MGHDGRKPWADGLKWTSGTIVVVALGIALFWFNRPKGPPTSEAEFVAAYRSAYNAGDRDAVLALVKWDGVPGELREFQEWTLTTWLGKNRIISIRMIPYVPDPAIPQTFHGRRVEANLAPRFWLIAENAGREGYQGGKSQGQAKCAVGIEEGIYRFCGMRWAEPSVPAERGAGE